MNGDNWFFLCFTAMPTMCHPLVNTFISNQNGSTRLETGLDSSFFGRLLGLAASNSTTT